MKETGRNSQLALHAQAERCPHISHIIDCNRYSSLSKLHRVTSYVIRFVKNCRSKRPNLDDLTNDELRETGTFWVRDMQSRISKEKLKDLEKRIGNFKDEKGIIHCQCRLANSSLSYGTRYQILLRKEHYVTHLIIWTYHKRVLHNGTKETLQELRSRFWIVQGRQLVKRILRSCILCRKLRGLSYGSPPYIQLPAFRVQEDYAFASVGIDFAGPLYV